MTQSNLGNALAMLGERESGTERLEEAVLAYREALKECTPDRVPLDWARTQMNLGNALSTLGERESGTERLEQAVLAYREALKEYTPDRVPLDWARSTGNQGIALMLLADRRSDKEWRDWQPSRLGRPSQFRGTAAMRRFPPILRGDCQKPAPSSIS
jgi:tetratricopeptide (TPR) repeat protein